jgi:hypothetical protein
MAQFFDSVNAHDNYPQSCGALSDIIPLTFRYAFADDSSTKRMIGSTVGHQISGLTSFSEQEGLLGGSAPRTRARCQIVAIKSKHVQVGQVEAWIVDL